jgi:hypothetical protein
MQNADNIALKRVRTLVEQYVLTRSRRYDFVSTELAYKAIREVMRTPIDEVELDRLVVESAQEKGLSVRFDRGQAACHGLAAIPQLGAAADTNAGSLC